MGDDAAAEEEPVAEEVPEIEEEPVAEEEPAVEEEPTPAPAVSDDPNKMMSPDDIAALLASIPYTRVDDSFENYFQAVLWLTFTLLGFYASCEMHQAHGRVDVVVEATSHVFVMELKRDGTAAEALSQIEERGYAAPFAAGRRQVHLIGASFDSDTRLLAEWEER
jgi:hypothetical protein